MASGDAWAVESDALSAGSGSVAGRVAEFDARFDNVRRLVENVAGMSWSGAAADAFLQGWMEWTRGAMEVRESLSGIGTLLRDAGLEYERVDGDAARAAIASTGGGQVSAFRLPPLGAGISIDDSAAGATGGR